MLHTIDFTITEGSITGLLGPSGCGKTTLMRTIVGTQLIRAGTLSVLGHRAGEAALRGAIGYGPQTASVYPDLTVSENLRYFASALRVPENDIAPILDRVDMTRLAGRLTGQLSGGERSRVSLAIALLGGPRLLVLDEPTVGLDPVLREDLWRLFGELAATGVTLLVSSHVMDEAERCHKILLMRDGHLLAHESPKALKQRTGTDTLDAAFLQLVSNSGVAA